VIEDDLKELRLSARADAARHRILTAAQSARRWQVIDRWIAGGVAASIALALLVGVVTNGTMGPRKFDTEAEELAAEIGALELAGALRRPRMPLSSSPWRYFDELP